jgi:hypothetical protein
MNRKFGAMQNVLFGPKKLHTLLKSWQKRTTVQIFEEILANLHGAMNVE